MPNQNKLQGSVYDANNLPLEFANVTVLNTEYGTVTDENGKFLLVGDFTNNDIIIVSYVGYKVKKISVGDFLKGEKVIYLNCFDISN